MTTEQESALAVAAQPGDAPIQTPEMPPQATEATVLSVETPAQSELSAVTALLEQLRADSARQCQYAKKQLFLARLSAGICGLVLAAVLCVCIAIAPRVHSVLQGADDVIAQAQVLANNLEIVSTQLAQSDLPAMLQNVDSLVTQSQEGITQALRDVEEALEVIQSFDIEALNSSVRDLNSIISPLARLLGK